MTTLNRIRVEWQGTPVVGPGITTFYTVGASSSLPASVKAFFLAVKATFPSGITWTIPNTGDTIDTDHGTINGVWTGSGGGTQVSGGTGTQWAAGAGGRITWATNGIYRGRRVVGTTYMVPLVLDYWNTGNGTVSSVATGNWSSAAAALISAEPGLSIYSREVFADPTHLPHPIVGSLGQASTVLAAVAHSPASSLRSRRV